MSSPAPPAASAPPQAVPAGQRPTIAVLGFRDLAGNPETAWLGVAFAEMLTTELAAGGQARLITGDNVTRVRQSLAIPYTEAPREPDLARLRSILGADLVRAVAEVLRRSPHCRVEPDRADGMLDQLFLHALLVRILEMRGEAGIGKTRLLEALAKSAAWRGCLPTSA